MNNITIATRASELALAQTELVRQQLLALQPGLSIEILPITTEGDKRLEVSLQKIGGKALFVKELQAAIMSGSADMAVHSMKDVPALLPKKTQLAAILEREDPRDVLVSQRGCEFAELAPGAKVGTSSLRRGAQCLAQRPDLEIVPCRGNVQTRLAKLDAGEFEALILAGAGLKRLHLTDRVSQWLPTELSLPAVGQGALGLECHVDNTELAALLGQLNHQHTAVCVTAERAMNALLGGTCQTPIAGYATLTNDVLRLQGIVARSDGSEVIYEHAEAPAAHATQLGQQVAEQLIGRGADIIITETPA